MWSRETTWRQGSFLSRPCVKEIGLCEPPTDSGRAIVVSHDCDLACDDLSTEPFVEVIMATRIESCAPTYTHAKDVRKLHLEINELGARLPYQLLAKDKTSVTKAALAQFQPDADLSLDASDLKTLQIWLACRYRRATIPDRLQFLIKETFESVGKKEQNAKAIRGIWIDFDPDEENLPPGERYELWVNVVYDTTVSDSKTSADAVSQRISEIFRKKYLKGGSWQELELRECTATADTEFTLFDVYRYKRFRLEHLSVRFGAQSETDAEG
jgi:hypothetical protein